MGYVAVKGGTAAIEESANRIKYERLRGLTVPQVQDIANGMRALVDTVMSEGSLYDRELAAIAIKQAEGSMEEAVFLLRAYRSTVERKHYSRVADTDNLRIERRISASFKDIPGGQILGAAHDYIHRLIDFSLVNEEQTVIAAWVDEYLHSSAAEYAESGKFSRVADYLREQGLMETFVDNNDEPIDITRKNLEFPTMRSERLQILTRGQTGAVTALGYAALRGYGDLHPTVGELRVGALPLYVGDPLSEDDDDSYYIGEIKVTEVETYVPAAVRQSDGMALRLRSGYGICYGQNETKAIAMSLLDLCLEAEEKRHPTQDEEFVLYHIDSVEATGFISHLKLPHYVTFKSKLDSVRKTGNSDDS